jgi:hypothetical protein
MAERQEPEDYSILGLRWYSDGLGNVMPVPTSKSCLLCHTAFLLTLRPIGYSASSAKYKQTLTKLNVRK